MRRYWDTSALVTALHDSKIEAMALQPDQWTRPHTLSEAFSTLTGGRLGFKYAPDDAAALLKEITGKMNFIELDKKQTLAAIAQAQKFGVRGGRIHDWLHARAATKAGVAILITENVSDFVGLEEGFKLASPAEVLAG